MQASFWRWLRGIKHAAQSPSSPTSWDIGLHQYRFTDSWVLNKVNQ